MCVHFLILYFHTKLNAVIWVANNSAQNQSHIRLGNVLTAEEIVPALKILPSKLEREICLWIPRQELGTKQYLELSVNAWYGWMNSHTGVSSWVQRYSSVTVKFCISQTYVDHYGIVWANVYSINNCWQQKVALRNSEMLASFLFSISSPCLHSCSLTI